MKSYLSSLGKRKEIGGILGQKKGDNPVLFIGIQICDISRQNMVLKKKQSRTVFAFDDFLRNIKF